MTETVAPDFVPADIMSRPLLEAPEIQGWRKVKSGKVREIYIPEDAAGFSSADRLLLVATDRISAFDYVLDSPIPAKGAVLTQLSRWWFEQLSGVVGSHFLNLPVPVEVAGRAMVTRRLEMYPVECVARGYLAGSGLAEYRENFSVCGMPLPPGLKESSKLSEPIFTPAVKAELGQHDENVSVERIAQLHGRAVAKNLTDLTLLIYRKAADIAAERGIILADTKFEFGAEPDFWVSGDTVEQATRSFVLADEVLTPDSSRFWSARQWVEGQSTPSFDKQYVRDWLVSSESGWEPDSGRRPPVLPELVVERTSQRYLQAYRILTGESLV